MLTFIIILHNNICNKSLLFSIKFCQAPTNCPIQTWPFTHQEFSFHYYDTIAEFPLLLGSQDLIINCHKLLCSLFELGFFESKTPLIFGTKPPKNFLSSDYIAKMRGGYHEIIGKDERVDAGNNFWPSNRT